MTINIVMTLPALLLSSALGFLGTGQTPVRLAGHWVIDQAATGTAARPSLLCGRECEISQDEKTLTIKGAREATYKLDGAPVTTTESTGQYSTTMVVTAKWEKGGLLITRKVGDNPESHTVLTIVDGKLVIETPSGGLSKGGKSVYVTKR